MQESTPMMIAARIREAIASGVIPPGAQIGEAEFARQLAVSRGPLREGLQRLAQEGLVVAVRNRGHFVIEMTPENVRDMYVARAAIERAAAARAHELNPQGTAALLLESVAAMKAAADQQRRGRGQHRRPRLPPRPGALRGEPAADPDARDADGRDADVHPRPHPDVRRRQPAGGGAPADRASRSPRATRHSPTSSSRSTWTTASCASVPRGNPRTPASSAADRAGRVALRG